MKNDPWYQEGLRFECTGCGACCTGGPGYVWVEQKEVEQMATFLGISPQDFCRKYIRRAMGRMSLIEKQKSYDCIFLKDKRCQLYHARPKQCRTFPFWKENLRSKEAWEEAAKACEGIRPEAPLIPCEEILVQLGSNIVDSI